MEGLKTLEEALDFMSSAETACHEEGVLKSYAFCCSCRNLIEVGRQAYDEVINRMGFTEALTTLNERQCVSLVPSEFSSNWGLVGDTRYICRFCLSDKVLGGVLLELPPHWLDVLRIQVNQDLLPLRRWEKQSMSLESVPAV